MKPRVGDSESPVFFLLIFLIFVAWVFQVRANEQAREAQFRKVVTR